MNGQEVDQALELKALQAENARLIVLLETHGIEWRLPPYAVTQHLRTQVWIDAFAPQ